MLSSLAFKSQSEIKFETYNGFFESSNLFAFENEKRNLDFEQFVGALVISLHVEVITDISKYYLIGKLFIN
jgi:hypothetical protein